MIRRMNGWTRTLLAAFVAGAISLGVAACGSSDDNGSSASGPGALKCKNGKILVGIAKAKSGVASFFDIAGTNGLLIAIDQINADGGFKGCPIKTMQEDTKSDPAVAAQVAQSLVDKDAQILVVPDDFDQGIAAARIGQKAGLLTLSLAASSTQFGKAVGDHFFSSGITTTQLGNAQAKFALSKNLKSTFQVVDPGLAYFTEQVTTYNDVYEPGGGKVVGSDKVDSLGGQTDFSSTISKIKSANPDVVQALMIYPNVGAFVKQLRAAGLDTTVVGNVTLDTRELPKQVGTSGVQNVFYATQVYFNGAGQDPQTDPKINEFTKQYQAKFGHFPEQENAPAAFQSFLAINEALQKDDVTDAATAADAIRQETNLSVPGGTLVRWQNGYAVWSPTIVGFTPDGQFEKIATYKPEG